MAGKNRGIEESVVRGWVKNQEKLKSFVGGKNVSVRQSRKVGCGRRALFPELENRLIAWVTQRNRAGLRVKDKYIEMQAKTIRTKLVEEIAEANNGELDDITREDVKKLEAFIASTSWLHRFKNRFELVSRRHTTSRSLPDGFESIACNFVADVQNLINDKKIEPERVVNLDQVPRYFETENNSTIITRGSREVTLRKASSSHKRFTATPIITSSGRILTTHLLFAKLKKIPLNIDPSCMVDVNNTGMWNDAVLTRVIETIIKKVQSPLLRQPVLILLDSYGTHKKHVEDKTRFYARMNVFLKLIPPNMTGLLQPLDVAVNRSFQQFYGDRYNLYMAKVVEKNDPNAMTKAGNIKMPKYQEISIWLKDWMKTLTAEFITKAFELCGLVSSANFNLEKLHKPLRDCFDDDFSIAQWEAQHAASFNNRPDSIEETFADWILYNVPFSFYKAIYEFNKSEDAEDFEFWLEEFKIQVIQYVKGDPLLNSLFKDDEKALLDSGKSTQSFVEMFAAARILNIQLKITEVDKDCNKIKEYKWGEKNCESEISLLWFEDIFGIVRKTD
jgi:hypothetical protein